LLLGDVEVTVDVDQMAESTQLLGESVGTTERFGGECGQMIDVLRLAGAEERLPDRIGQDARIERVFESVECSLATGELIERRPAPSVTSVGSASTQRRPPPRMRNRPR
jgi:hypothetical protein